jgi:hypothetical protein
MDRTSHLVSADTATNPASIDSDTIKALEAQLEELRLKVDEMDKDTKTANKRVKDFEIFKVNNRTGVTRCMQDELKHLAPQLESGLERLAKYETGRETADSSPNTALRRSIRCSRRRLRLARSWIRGSGPSSECRAVGCKLSISCLIKFLSEIVIAVLSRLLLPPPSPRSDRSYPRQLRTPIICTASGTWRSTRAAPVASSDAKAVSSSLALAAAVAVSPCFWVVLGWFWDGWRHLDWCWWFGVPVGLR